MSVRTRFILQHFAVLSSESQHLYLAPEQSRSPWCSPWMTLACWSDPSGQTLLSCILFPLSKTRCLHNAKSTLKSSKHSFGDFSGFLLLYRKIPEQFVLCLFTNGKQFFAFRMIPGKSFDVLVLCTSFTDYFTSLRGFALLLMLEQRCLLIFDRPVRRLCITFSVWLNEPCF